MKVTTTKGMLRAAVGNAPTKKPRAPSVLAMFRTADSTLGYIPATSRCFRTSWGTVTAHDASAAHADAWTSTKAECVFGCQCAMARRARPSTANWIAPTGNAKADVNKQPFTSVFVPNSASVFAPVRVCASVRSASAGYIKSCAAARLPPPRRGSASRSTGPHSSVYAARWPSPRGMRGRACASLPRAGCSALFYSEEMRARARYGRERSQPTIDALLCRAIFTCGYLARVSSPAASHAVGPGSGTFFEDLCTCVQRRRAGIGIAEQDCPAVDRSRPALLGRGPAGAAATASSSRSRAFPPHNFLWTRTRRTRS